MRVAVAMLIIASCAECRAQVNEWHPLTKLTVAQRSSHSYRFLVGKFGADHLLTECDTEMAALDGEDYLFQVMGEGVATRDGLTIGYGRTLQQAIDSAARSYISGRAVRAIERQEEREGKQNRQREAAFRKKCCAGDKP